MDFQCCVILTLKKEDILLCVHHLNHMLTFTVKGKPFAPHAIHLRITEFLDITHQLVLWRNTVFRNWIHFHHQVKELNPLDRADFIHQTRSSFHNNIFFQNTTQWTKSRNSMILSVIQCQNILKLSYSCCPELCIQLQTFST